MSGSLFAYFAYWAQEPRRFVRLLNPWAMGKDAEF